MTSLLRFFYSLEVVILFVSFNNNFTTHNFWFLIFISTATYSIMFVSRFFPGCQYVFFSFASASGSHYLLGHRYFKCIIDILSAVRKKETSFQILWHLISEKQNRKTTEIPQTNRPSHKSHTRRAKLSLSPHTTHIQRISHTSHTHRKYKRSASPCQK